MLSFGEEAEEEENQLASVKTKIKSSHDVLNDPRLLKGEDLSKELVRVLSPPLIWSGKLQEYFLQLYWSFFY